MHEILHAVFFKNLQAMTAAEAGADRTDIAAVLLEDNEVILWVIRHQVDAACLVFGQCVRVDDRRDGRIGLGPFQIKRVTGRAMAEDDWRIGGEDRRNEKQGEQAHVGFG